MNTQPFTGFRPHSVLADFVFNKKTGILHCFPYHRKIYFEAGRLVFSESDLESEHFARILVRQGVLTAFQLEELERDLPPDASVGKALRQLGYADGRQLAKALVQQITDIVTQVVSQEEGELAIELGALPDALPRLKIQTLPLLVQILTATGTVETVSFSPEEPALEPAHDFLERLPEDFPQPYDRFRRFANGKAQFSFRDLNDAMELGRHEVHAFLYLLDLMNIIKIHPSKRVGLDLQTLLKESQDPPKPKDPVVLGANVHEQATPDSNQGPPEANAPSNQPSTDAITTPDASTTSDQSATALEQENAPSTSGHAQTKLQNNEQDSLDDVSYESLAAATAGHEAFTAATSSSGEGLINHSLNPTPDQAIEAERAAAEFLAGFDTTTEVPASASMTNRSEDNQVTENDKGEHDGQQVRAEGQTQKLRRGVILPDRPDPFDEAQLNHDGSGSHRFLLWVALVTCLVLGGMFAMWKLELFNQADNQPDPESPTASPVADQATPPADTTADTLQLGDGQPLATESTYSESPVPEGDFTEADQGEMTTPTLNDPGQTTGGDVDLGQTGLDSEKTAFDLHAVYRSKNRRLSNATLDAMITDSEIALLENNASYTIAFLVACNPDTLREFLDRDELSPLYLLPRQLNGQRCYLLSWNHFDSQEAAQSAINQLPASLRAQGPWVFQIP